MSKSVISVILSLFIVFIISAQSTEDTSEEFDSIYFHIATNLAGNNIDRAFQVSDSLYRTSVSDLHKVKSLMLLSSLHQQKGESEQAIIQADRAEQIASKTKLYDWQARISGFLSTQYRNIGLLEKGKTYLDKGLKASKQVTNENYKNLYLGMVYQEITYYNIEDQDPDKAIESVRLADEYFQKMIPHSQKDYFIATNYQLFGRVYLKKKQYDPALEYYQKALTLLTGITDKNALINGFIYSGMGNAYLNKKDYPITSEYLSKADSIAVSSDNVNLKLEVYDAFAAYYKAIDDYKNHSLYRDKFVETQKLYELNKKQSIDNIVKALQLSNKDLSYNSILLKTGIIALLVLGLIFIFFYQQKKKKDIRKFKLTIEELTKEIKVIESSINKNKNPKKESDQDNIPKKTVNISEKKEKEITKGLKEFEQNKGFLERSISLSILAGILNTNTIYVSYVLNNYYNKDFNTYINELRIRYIVQKLKENKDYRHYKISYLAEESGFSSHSKFSAIFKLVTGFSPSVLINYLDKNKTE